MSASSTSPTSSRPHRTTGISASAARHRHPRHLRPAHRPHAGRAGRDPLRRRRRSRRGSRLRRRPRSSSPSIPASSRSAPTARRRSRSTCPTSTAPSASWRWPGQQDGVGHAIKDVIVRDPVVVTASIPRFLAAGDTSRLLVEINNVSGAAGDYQLSIASGDGDRHRRHRRGADGDARREAEGRASTSRSPANAVGDFDVHVSLACAGGDSLAEEPDARRPAAGPAGDAAEHRRGRGGRQRSPSTTGCSRSSCPARHRLPCRSAARARSTCAGILAALDRYPYGCAEQLTSRALPLVYLDDVARIGRHCCGHRSEEAGTGRRSSGVLANQSASGSFGLWGPEGAGNDLWLDAYVTDFLTRAAEKGYDVPKLARDLALDNLSNRIAYAERLRQWRRGHRLCALRAGAHGPGCDRRPPLLRRTQARCVPHAARQGPGRRGDGALRRPAAGATRVHGGDGRPRSCRSVARLPARTTARNFATRRRC